MSPSEGTKRVINMERHKVTFTFTQNDDDPNTYCWSTIVSAPSDGCRLEDEIEFVDVIDKAEEKLYEKFGADVEVIDADSIPV